MKHILVTGGAGFIGSHLVEALLNYGYAVRVLDNLSSGQRNWVHPDAEWMEGDIRDIAICRQAAVGISGIFHCAAMSRSHAEVNYVQACTEVNVVGTQNILLAAYEQKVSKVIYSASSTCYGNEPTPHQVNKTTSTFLNAYALSKYIGEQYCLLFNTQFNLPCVILRYFNVYGLRQPEVGQDALVLGVFLRCFLEGKSLPIQGTGEQRRDFIHVHDVVQANLLALEQKNTSPLIFNVGSGENISIKALANLISNKQYHVPKRLGDAKSTLADIAETRAILRWKPTISLHEGLNTLLSTMRSEMEDVVY